MKTQKQLTNKELVIRQELLAYDLIRILFFSKWNFEILSCLIAVPLYFTDNKKKPLTWRR